MGNETNWYPYYIHTLATVVGGQEEESFVPLGGPKCGASLITITRVTLHQTSRNYP